MKLNSDDRCKDERLDITTFDDVAKGFTRTLAGNQEYLEPISSDVYAVGLRDFTMQVNGYWNPDPASESSRKE